MWSISQKMHVPVMAIYRFKLFTSICEDCVELIFFIVPLRIFVKKRT